MFLFISMPFLSSSQNFNCDYFPDFLENENTFSCCKKHDICYQINECTINSWIPFTGTEECNKCNWEVFKCMFNLS